MFPSKWFVNFDQSKQSVLNDISKKKKGILLFGTFNYLYRYICCRNVEQFDFFFTIRSIFEKKKNPANREVDILCNVTEKNLY